MQLPPPNKTETILCAVASIRGNLVYYGRGIESGDWYLAAPFDIDPEMLLGAVEEAKREGEQIIFHPHGPVMFRLDWTASDDRYPQDQDGAALMKKILEQIPPQSSS